MTIATEGPRIFDYAAFAPFMRDYVEFKSRSSKGTSLRALAKRLGKSPSLLAMVARGERIPTPELTTEVCSALRLDRKQTNYAVVLNGYHRAKEPGAKARFATELRALSPNSKDLLLSLDHFALMANWHHTVIMELLSLPGFIEEPASIARLLGPSVSESMVEESLSLLQRLDLIGRDEHGALRKLPSRVNTPQKVPSAAVRTFHKQVMGRAHVAIERQPIEERFFTTATIPVPKASVPEIRERIVAFRDELLGTIREREHDADEVYHLSLQFFRATQESLSSK